MIPTIAIMSSRIGGSLRSPSGCGAIRLDPSHNVEDRAFAGAREGAVRLVLEGVDTFATVTLNGLKLGTTSSVFVTHSFGLPAGLLERGVNTLLVAIDAPKAEATARSERYPYEVPFSLYHNVWSEPSHRNFARKPQSDFGWDSPHPYPPNRNPRPPSSSSPPTPSLILTPPTTPLKVRTPPLPQPSPLPLPQPPPPPPYPTRWDWGPSFMPSGLSGARLETSTSALEEIAISQTHLSNGLVDMTISAIASHAAPPSAMRLHIRGCFCVCFHVLFFVFLFHCIPILLRLFASFFHCIPHVFPCVALPFSPIYHTR